MALTADIALQLNAGYSPITPPDIGADRTFHRLAEVLSLALTDGTGDGQANRIWHDERTVNAATNDDIDLSGTLTDPFGVTVTFARVKALCIYHKSGTNNLTIGGSPTNPWISWLAASGDGVLLRGNAGTQRALLLLTAPDATGYAVTGGSADVLRVANGAGSAVTYRIFVIGAAS